MPKLHELLAAEKTPMAAANTVAEETVKKFKNPSHFFEGHSKSLAMIEDSPQNKAIEAAAREEKPVTTTVFDTLDYFFGIWVKAEDLQFQKNATNRVATGTVELNGAPFLQDLPVDELLGLEARLGRLRTLISEAPTLDATRNWAPGGENAAPHTWVTVQEEVNTKTEKVLTPVILHAATKEHPAQVEKLTKDVVVGSTRNRRRSGAASALQKAEAIKRCDTLIEEVKRARMRANSTEVVVGTIASRIAEYLLAPFATTTEDHQ